MANDTQQKRILMACGALGLIVLGWGFWTRLPPPQLPLDEQVFTTVDALFTALTSRDKSRLLECERRLKAYQTSGKLPAAAAARLNSILDEARQQEWQTAAEHLYHFIAGQRGSRQVSSDH